MKKRKGSALDLDVSLERRSKEEVVAIIKQMLERHPDLEALVEVPADRAKEPDYRREAEKVFREIGSGNGANAGIARGLQPLKDRGDALLEAEDYSGAAAVYEGICGAIGRFGEMVTEDEFDEENLLGELATDCVNKLGQCLDPLADDPVRRVAILRALWEVYQSDVEMGGLDIGEGADSILLEKTTPEERRTVAAWVRAAMPSGKNEGDRWRQQSLGGFLLDLEKDTLDDETYLRTCRETGRRIDLITRLLALKRFEEAIPTARAGTDEELLLAVDLLVKHGHGDEAEKLVRERAERSTHAQLFAWLKARVASRGDRAAMLELAQTTFRRLPNMANYQEVRKLAQGLKRWEALQPELMAFVQTQGPWLRVHIHLDEGDIDKALEVAHGKLPEYEAERVKLHVAQAAEKSRPRAALEIYRKQVDRVLQHPGRRTYEEACQLLKKVRDLYRQLGETEAWEQDIANLREKFRRSPLLQEEMTRAGLGKPPESKKPPRGRKG